MAQTDFPQQQWQRESLAVVVVYQHYQQQQRVAVLAVVVAPVFQRQGQLCVSVVLLTVAVASTKRAREFLAVIVAVMT